MKKLFNLVAATFVAIWLFFGSVLILTEPANADRTQLQSSIQNTNGQGIAQSCTNIEIRPNGNQNASFGKGTKWVTCTNYRLELQSDGNFVLYNTSGKPIWATGTEGRGAKLNVQADGNVVLYDASNRALWATDTNPNSGIIFAIQTDGNLVVYRSDGRPIWSAGTDGGKNKTLNAANEWFASHQPPSTFVQRGKVWVDRQIPYNQGVTANPDGSRAASNTGFRTDCSGFLSMAWGLPATGLSVPVTGNLGNYANTFTDKNQLQPGDAINNRKVGNDGHVVLFVRWIDKNQGTFVAYEENGGQGKAVQTNLTLVSNNQRWTINQYPGLEPWVFQRKK
jgi:hypothetical protein